jgi:amino acid transporter
LGFQEGYWAWVAGVVDNALYPTLTIAVISEGYGSFGTPLTLYLLKAGISIVLAIPGLYGINLIGNSMGILTIFVLIPFIVMFFLGLSQANWSNLLQVRHEIPGDPNTPLAIDWNLLLNILFWNFNGFHGVSVFAGEVATPSKSYPKALGIVVLLIIFACLVPLSIATAVNEPPWYTWEEGSLSEIATHIGGPFLTASVVVASCCTNIGMYMTELFVDSFQLLGMAELGLAPSVFAKRHSVYGTPRNAIYASVVVILLLSAFDFKDILVIDNCLSSLSVVLSLAAAVKLRTSHSKVPRPFRIPGDTTGMILLTILPVCIAIYIAYTSLYSLPAIIMVVIVLILGGVLYWVSMI